MSETLNRGRVAACSSMRVVLVSALAIICCFGIFVDGARAAGKPEKSYLEGKFHVMYTGLRSTELSRFTGNELHAESSRDVRVIPGILRYTQSFALPLYDLRSSYDAITEFYAEDLEQMTAAFASPASMGSIPWLSRYTGGGMGAGARPWRPISHGPVIMKDHVIVDGYEQGYKWFSFMRRKEGVSKKQADDYMRAKYAPAIAKLPGVRRYVLGQTYQPKGATGIWASPQNWDIVDMIWFDSLDDMMNFLGSVDYQENVLRPAEASIIDQSKTVSFASEYYERVPFPPRYEGPTWDEIRPATSGK